MVQKMKNLDILFLALLISVLSGCASHRIYVGGSDGIWQVKYTSFGLPVPRSWYAEKMVRDTHVSSMTVKGKTIYAARRMAKGGFCVETFRILRNGLLKKIDAFIVPGNHGYCHISVSRDGKYCFGSSYSGGFTDVLSLVPEGGVIRLKQRISFSGKSIHKRQKSPHPHFAAQTPDASMVLAADLGSDRIHILKEIPGKGFVQKGSVPLPPGSGPRHLSFSADGKFFFAVNELNNTVCSFRMEKDKVIPVSVCSLLPAAWSGTSYAGAIKTSPDGKLYVTNRGHDSVTVLSVAADGKLKLDRTFSSEGNFPYDLLFFMGRLFVVNMKSDCFSIWEREREWKREHAFIFRRPMCIVTPER